MLYVLEKINEKINENIVEEVWADIEGYEGYYQVNTQGRVRSLDREVTYANGRVCVHKGKIISGTDNGQNYLIVNLRKDGKRKSFLIHRLVALTFIPNPNGFDLINHKNEVKTDNRYENLEWCDYNYNLNYGTIKERQKKTYVENKKNGFHKSFRKVTPIRATLADGTQLDFMSMRQASFDPRIRLSPTAIKNLLEGKNKNRDGIVFEYLK